jgi:hypothetical protein
MGWAALSLLVSGILLRPDPRCGLPNPNLILNNKDPKKDDKNEGEQLVIHGYQICPIICSLTQKSRVKQSYFENSSRHAADTQNYKTLCHSEPWI